MVAKLKTNQEIETSPIIDVYLSLKVYVNVDEDVDLFRYGYGFHHHDESWQRQHLGRPRRPGV